MPVKEKNIKIYIIIGAVCYLLLFYFSLHMGHVVYVNETEITQSITNTVQFGGNSTNTLVKQQESINWITIAFDAFVDMSENPLDFWPISIKFLITALFFLICDAIGIGWILAVGETKRQDAPNQEHGSARWNLDYAGYYKQTLWLVQDRRKCRTPHAVRRHCEESFENKIDNHLYKPTPRYTQGVRKFL